MNSRIDINISETLEQQFEECVIEHGKSLFHYIFSLVKHKELAEDLYQEVLLSAYLALPSFKEEAKMKTWMYRIAINKCRDYWRKEKASKKFWEEKVYLYANDVTSALEPEESILQRCSQEEMEHTLNELPPIYRDPLLLFYYHHHTLVEISDTAKLPLSTVKTRLKRGKDRLLSKVQKLEMHV